jgi:hypothetical protein
VTACWKYTSALTSQNGSQVRDRERQAVGTYQVRLLQQRAETAEEESREAMRAARGAEVESKNTEGERQETGRRVEVLRYANVNRSLLLLNRSISRSLLTFMHTSARPIESSRCSGKASEHTCRPYWGTCSKFERLIAFRALSSRCVSNETSK